MKMKIRFFLLGLMLAFSSTALSFDHAHKDWDGVLKRYQNSAGLVNYKGLKQDAKAKEHSFNAYVDAVQKVQKGEYEKWSKQEKMAFLINAYNALTVKLIIDHYPVPSIKKIGGLFTKPWDVKFFSLLDGAIKSLDPIEHKWLRPHFKDYRIHAAVNCASISCPPLRNEAFLATKLDAQLDEQMRLWLADPQRNKFDPEKGSVLLSKIFDWYEDDFNQWGGGVKTVVLKYGPAGAQQALAKKGKISYLDYDWNLNEAK